MDCCLLFLLVVILFKMLLSFMLSSVFLSIFVLNCFMFWYCVSSNMIKYDDNEMNLVSYGMNGYKLIVGKIKLDEKNFFGEGGDLGLFNGVCVSGVWVMFVCFVLFFVFCFC